MTMHSAQNLQIAQRRTFFAISVKPGGAGPFLSHPHATPPGQRIHWPSVCPVTRDAALFNANDADAILRAHPRYSVLQAVQVGGDDAAAND